MPTRMTVTFVWRDDDDDFVAGLLEELREVATAVDHARLRHKQRKLMHLINLRAAPANAEACVGLLCGIAEAGARVVIDLSPEGGD